MRLNRPGLSDDELKSVSRTTIADNAKKIKDNLAGRIVIDRAKPMSATLAARRVLERNGIVSITAGAWEGQRLAVVELLGGTLELAVGAPGLARLTGAPLLPVFAVRDDAGALRVTLDAPIPVAREGDTDAALQEAAQRFAGRLEPWIRRYPAQWRDWKSLQRTG